MQQVRVWIMAGLVGAVAASSGCVTNPVPPKQAVSESSAPAWSYNALPDEMVVALSPAGDTLRWGGSIGTVVGQGVDMAQNAKYRDRIDNALGGFDSGAAFEEVLQAHLEHGFNMTLQRVRPLTSMAGHPSRRAAREAHYDGIAKDADLLLEVQSTHGVFSPEVIVAASVSAQLLALPGPDTLWKMDIAASPLPVLATMPLTDPTNTLSILPSFNPRLLPEEEKLDAILAGDMGKPLEAQFREIFANISSALLCDMGLAEDAEGFFVLGKNAMNRKRFAKAQEHFEKALQLEPGHLGARNAMAVNRYHSDDLDGAITEAEAIVAHSPGFAPAHFNLAYWLGVEQGDAAAAKPHYDEALDAGLPVTEEMTEMIVGEEG